MRGVIKLDVTDEVLKHCVEEPDFILEDYLDPNWNYYIKSYLTGVLFILAKRVDDSKFEIRNWNFVNRQ